MHFLKNDLRFFYRIVCIYIGRTLYVIIALINYM